MSYSFSPRVFVQSLIQYNDRADAWTSNFRFGWLQQANTGVFLVYTDSHDLDDRCVRAAHGHQPQPDSQDQPDVRRHRLSLEQVGRVGQVDR